MNIATDGFDLKKKKKKPFRPRERPSAFPRSALHGNLKRSQRYLSLSLSLSFHSYLHAILCHMNK